MTPSFSPGFCLQVLVKAAETVLVEGIGHRFVVELSVLLQVIEKISITTVLEDQVRGFCW